MCKNNKINARNASHFTNVPCNGIVSNAKIYWYVKGSGFIEVDGSIHNFISLHLLLPYLELN